MNSTEFLRENHPQVYNSDCVGFTDLVKVIEDYFEYKKTSILEAVDDKIREFEGGDEMKSMNESFRDDFLVSELKELKNEIKQL